jgi:hypothetical protein
MAEQYLYVISLLLSSTVSRRVTVLHITTSSWGASSNLAIMHEDSGSLSWESHMANLSNPKEANLAPAKYSSDDTEVFIFSTIETCRNIRASMRSTICETEAIFKVRCC